ncbi:hypothetical protein FB451DRAFT_1175820 [Mycena latifolia]|nr:hypothetical protein FB451DRAFT_1175820 [Mycena latifolia]
MSVHEAYSKRTTMLGLGGSVGSACMLALKLAEGMDRLLPMGSICAQLSGHALVDRDSAFKVQFYESVALGSNRAPSKPLDVWSIATVILAGGRGLGVEGRLRCVTGSGVTGASSSARASAASTRRARHPASSWGPRSRTERLSGQSINGGSAHKAISQSTRWANILATSQDIRPQFARPHQLFRLRHALKFWPSAHLSRHLHKIAIFLPDPWFKFEAKGFDQWIGTQDARTALDANGLWPSLQHARPSIPAFMSQLRYAIRRY